MSAAYRCAARALVLVVVCAAFGAATPARAQQGFFASIAYSQKTGKVGYSARQARTKQQADALALRMCASPDAKVYMWARDQWVAIAVVDKQLGNAGFGRGLTPEEAQQRALDECSKRAEGRAYRVVLCVHSDGRRLNEVRSVAAAPVKSRTGFFAALAYSPSTGKIGHTVGKAKTIDEAKKLAIAACDAPDAKVFMWGDLWIAIATTPDAPGIAGFGPGETRELAEKAALEQATKLAKGAPVEVAMAIYSTGEEDPAVLPASATAPAARSSAPARLPQRLRPRAASNNRPSARVGARGSCASRLGERDRLPLSHLRLRRMLAPRCPVANLRPPVAVYGGDPLALGSPLAMLHAFLTRYRAAYAGLPRDVWLLSLALFINRCGTMVMPFLTIYLTSQLGMSEAAAGRMISVYGLGSVCGAYLSGRWCERVGPVRMQIICFFLAAPGYLLIGAWDTWPGVAASLFFLSVVNEAFRPANATAITRLTTPENRTRAFSLQRLAANLGFSFGPVIGGFLAQRNFSLLFVVDAASTLAAAIVLVRFFGLRRVDPARQESEARAVHASPLADRGFVGFLGLSLLSMMVFLQFGSTYPLYLRDHFGMNEPQIGLMFAVNTTIIVAVEMLLINAVQRWPLVGTIAWGSFLSCLGFGMLPLGSSGAYAVLAMAVVTMGEMLTFPLASAFVAGRGKRGSEGLYNGWYMVVNALAWVLGPAIGSAIYGANPDALWYTAIGVGVLVLIGFRLLASREGDQSVASAEPGELNAAALVPPAEVTLDQVAPVGS